VEAASPPPSMRLHLSSHLLPSFSSTSTTILTLLLLPRIHTFPHLAQESAPPAPCGCITKSEAASLPQPSPKLALVSVSECHEHCSEAPFFTFPYGFCVCGVPISHSRPCSWTEEDGFREVEVFCLSTPSTSVSNSLVEVPPDYTITAIILLLAATSCLTIACTRSACEAKAARKKLETTTMLGLGVPVRVNIASEVTRL